ncbi:phosphodiesterase [Ruegeria pomeroyi]|uniref:Phosphodiesterase n=1 Tax=Ruegeria alba TaxID=2916756 RepID=A0ABS9NVS7_9RHOB|nr:phosphodiesterase [Ruegeria alba]MCE8513529.1 phosphodiesterase [Ruegeria pomeroyi]MCE8521300.1 phosphodiesterase [Ruegeria pomeroyi]MCE8525746.1 phosphodiesterase [Ruegeria pomeroyi]MCE8529214.1 phosphodiesterase [Ruegeria pomeroyi]MCE8546999.1 phosphodiesterase [Ruegeria pomeroyi]
MKFIHLSDIHLMPPGQSLSGSDPIEKLSKVLEDIATWHCDAEFCVISGDLADLGDRECYEWLRERLAHFPVPVFLMLGNHDVRETFLSVFPDHPRDANGFIQHGHTAGGARFLFLDTLTGGPDIHDGELCDDRLAWLAAELERAGDMPVYVFLHHPPFDIAIPYVDEIKLRQPDAFHATLQAGRNIRHVFYGHVHRTTYVNWRGYPFTSLPSTNHQVPLIPEREGQEHSAEPLAYGVATIEGDQFTLHVDSYLGKPGA